VYLRLGDGLCAKNDNLCRGSKAIGEPNCWENLNDCWKYETIDGIYYAFSKEYYKNVIRTIPKSVKSITIFGNPYHWTRTPDPRAGNYDVDNQYRNNVLKFFESHGYKVNMRASHFSPDEDFIYACFAKVFIRGGGGFSKLISDVVTQMNGKTIMPSLK